MLLTWISRTRVGWIDPILLHSGKELTFLLHHLGLVAPVGEVEDLAADAGAGQPAHSGAGQGQEAESDKGIERNLHDKRLGKAG